MQHSGSKSRIRPLRIVAALTMALSLSGCLALPGAISIGSLAIDGLSMLASGKSLSDHALSMVTERDCVVMRVLMSEPICSTHDLAEIDETERMLSAVGETRPDTLFNAEDERLRRLSEAWLNGDEGTPIEPTVNPAVGVVAALDVKEAPSPAIPMAKPSSVAVSPVGAYEMRIIGVMSAHPPAAD